MLNLLTSETKNWLLEKDLGPNNLVLIREVDETQQAHQMKFTKAPYWIRLHDLPIRASNVYNGSCGGIALEEVVEVDLEEDEVEWGKLMLSKGKY